ncbi:MAG: hypothetical protein ABEK04_04105, partial [Candidatus Nanohalobium sp.]
NRRQDIFRVQIKPVDPRTTQEIELGDAVTAKDLTAMDVNNEFRVVGMDINRASGGEGTVLHLSNRPLRLTERLRDIKRSTDTTSTHMQGATNIDSQNFGDNCDNSHPLKTELRIPDDAVAINKAEIAFSREPFRGYVKNQEHSHDVTVTHPSHSHDVTHPSHSHDVTVVENLNHGFLWFNPGVTVDTSSSPLRLDVQTLSPPSGNFDGMQATIQIFNKTGSSQTYDWRVEDSNGNVIEDLSGSKTISDDSFFSWNRTLSSSEISSNETLTLEVFDGTVGTASGKGTEGGISFFLASKAQETSTTELGTTETSTTSLGTNETSTSTNSGAPSYGIFEPTSEPDIDVEVIVDNNSVTT